MIDSRRDRWHWELIGPMRVCGRGLGLTDMHVEGIGAWLGVTDSLTARQDWPGKTRALAGAGSDWAAGSRGAL